MDIYELMVGSSDSSGSFRYHASMHLPKAFSIVISILFLYEFAVSPIVEYWVINVLSILPI
jgi:amino acid permease